jgi:hypothetical protein
MLPLLLCIITIILTGCKSAGDAPQAIEGYIQALTDKDVVGATGASCLEWEEAAYAEASSFEAVEVSLEGLDCSSSGSDGEFSLVRCEGKIVANYGGELQDIELSLRTYRALIEQGEWKMCGYASH